MRTMRAPRLVAPVCFLLASSCHYELLNPSDSSRQAELQFPSGPGCGVALIAPSGEVELVQIDRSELPGWIRSLARRTSREEPERELFAVVSAGRFVTTAGEQATAVCAVPLGASVDENRLNSFVRAAIRSSNHSRRFVNAADSTHTDLASAALFSTLLQPGQHWHRQALGGRQQMRSVDLTASINGPYQLARWVITASPNGQWFFDMRLFAGLWASLIKWTGTLQVEVNSIDGPGVPCALLSDTWHELEAFRQELLSLKEAILSGALDGQNFDEITVCPDSLMDPGQYCLDFFIAAPRVMNLLGDNRNPNAYATIEQSKVFVIPDFGSNAVSIQVSGTHSMWVVPFSFGRSGLPFTVTAIYHPPNSTFQVERLRITAPDSTSRLLSIAVKNALCAEWEAWLSTKIPSPIAASALKAGCPTIDAEVRFTLTQNGWRPLNVVRDAFPSLSIIRMNNDRTLEIFHHSPEGPASRALLFLFGIDKLIYDVEAKQEELLSDLGSSSCALQ